MTDPSKSTKARRTPDEIAADKRAKIERSIERAKQDLARSIGRRIRLSEGGHADYKSARAHEVSRNEARDFQQGGIDFISGNTTDLSRAFAAEVVRLRDAVVEKERLVAVSSDPTNITGHSAKPNGKQQRQIDEARRLASGIRKIVIPDPDHPNQNVVVDAVASPVDGISSKRKKRRADPDYENYLKAADDATKRFQQAFEQSEKRGLQSPQMSDRVDGGGGGAGSALDVAIRAREHLRLVKNSVGVRNYALLYVRLGIEASVRTLREAGGRQHVVNSHDFEVALNALIAHYGGYVVRDPNWDAAEKIMRNAERARKDEGTSS